MVASLGCVAICFVELGLECLKMFFCLRMMAKNEVLVECLGLFAF